MPLDIGSRLGSYEIVALIGAGGMGKVYRAKDLKLGRDVAVKVLHEQLASDHEQLQRFEQEARSASALNHPNIVVVYEIGRHGSTPFIAMELLDGRPLRQILAAGPLSERELLAFATQVAEGLAKAHAAGIIHRDVKPENLLVTRDGFVKILDFGLAKLYAAGSSESKKPVETAQVLTESGVLLGTVSYMSPEQAKGERVDFRSDQFAFGAVLYEMATGQMAFNRSSVAETLTAILEKQPEPLGSFVPHLAQLDRLTAIVERCLKKNPKERYDTTKDLARDLDALREDNISGPTDVGLAVPTVGRARRFGLALAAVALLAGVIGALLRPRDEVIPRLTNAMQLTSAVGAEVYPSWSPDGQTVAYHSSESGNMDVWVTQLSGGAAVNRTEDHAGADGFPSWSPDGTQIAFWSERDGGGYFIMGVLGGPPRKVTTSDRVVATNASPPQWSADGTELAGVVYDDTGAVAKITSLSSGDSRRVALPGRAATRRLDLSWSPDGRYFAYVDAPDLTAQVTRLWLAPAAGGDALAVSDGLTNDRSPSWSQDVRTLFFVSNRGGSMNVWQQRIGDEGRLAGPPQPLTTGIGVTHAVFSVDGSKLIYSKGRQVGNLWRVPILDRPATWALARQVTFDNALIEMVDVSPDGKRLLVSSDRSGNPDLWLMPVEGGEMQQWTTDPTPDWAPRWSPDGREVAFYASRTGNRDIHVMPAGGGVAKQFAPHEAEDLYPAWSPDGDAIVFYSHRSGNRDIWVLRAEADEAQQLTVDPGRDRFPQWSPDGKWLVFSSDRTGAQRLWRVPAAGGEPESMTQGPAGFSRWSPDGRRIYFLGDGERAGNLWVVSVEDGEERPLTDFVGRPGKLAPFALATNGDDLFFTWQEDLGDLWVMDVVEESLE